MYYAIAVSTAVRSRVQIISHYASLIIAYSTDASKNKNKIVRIETPFSFFNWGERDRCLRRRFDTKLLPQS